MTHRRSPRAFPALLAAAACAATVLTATVLTGTATAGAASASGATAAPPASAVSAASTASTSGQSYNGTALTPPMGFNSWYQYRCGITEDIVLATARAMVSSGLARLGYRYVNLDDCWPAPARAADGQLQADPTRFPHGIAWLADQVHAMGLKLGIYESVGTTTCQRLPGSFGHYQQDADTFASWGVDFVKFDTCGSVQGTDISADYEQMSQDLLATGRPIVYSEELPIAAGNADSSNSQYLPLISTSSQISNMWRVAPDLYPNFDGTVFGHLTEDLPLAGYAHPGAWNDLDMLATGTSEFQWTPAEERTQMSIWAELGSPLLISADLTNMSAADEAVLSNSDVIAVDQDSLGEQGRLVAQDGPVYIVTKPLANGDASVLFVNTSSVPRQAGTTAQTAGLPGADSYAVRNLWTGATRESAGAVTASIPAAGSVMYRVSPLPGTGSGGVGDYAPATRVSVTVPDASSASSASASAGQTVTVPATFANDGRQAVTGVSLSLAVPGGWKVSGGPATSGAVPGGRQLNGSWQVTIPPGTTPADYTVTATARYTWSTTHAASDSGQGDLEVGDALAGYTADEFGVSQKYPPYGSQVTPLYREVRPGGSQTLRPGDPVAVGSDPSGVAVTPDGRYAYVTNHGSGTVSVIDTAANAVVATVRVGSGPYGIAISPDGRDAYVADNGSGAVSVIDTASNTVVATVGVGSGPYGVAITPDGGTVYVSNQSAGTVTPIDTADDTAGAPIPVGASPRQIAIAPDGGTAYVANMGSASVTPIATATNTAGSPIPLPCSGPDGATVDPANSTLYVTCFGAPGTNTASHGAIVPIDLATGQPGAQIQASAHPEGIVATPSGDTLYATDAFQSTITPIEAAAGAPGPAIHVPGAYGIALLPANP